MDLNLHLARLFAQEHPQETAHVLEGLDLAEVRAFLEPMPAPAVAEVLGSMEGFMAARCLEEMEAELAGAALEHMPLERAAWLLRRLDGEQCTALVASLPAAIRQPLEQLLRYPEGTAGALMNPRVFTLPADIAVQEALRRVQAHSSEAMYYLYVVGPEQELVGVVTMRELMVAEPGSRLEEIMRTHPLRLSADMSLAAVLVHPGWLEFHALPVVDEQGRLVGALRNKKLRRLKSEEAGRRADGVEAAGAALGELYRIGLSALFKGTTSQG
jgi:Mg/Co/Ni transporter MgtE